MKALITYAFLFISLMAFSQEKQTVESGYITFNSGTTLHFKNLTIDGENVKYFNEVSQSEMSFSTGAIKKIVDNTGTTIYDAGKSAVKTPGNSINTDKKVLKREKTDEEKLVYKSIHKIMLNGQQISNKELESMLWSHGEVYDSYKTGKSTAFVGDHLMWGGIGFFIGAGISNLILANNNRRSAFGPILLIVGLSATAVGIPVKLIGRKKMKNALQEYNNAPANQITFNNKQELKIIAGASGVGFQLQF